MLTIKHDGDALGSSFRWVNEDHSVVIGAQTSNQTGRAFVHLGHPLLGMQLTEAEALAIAESFSETLAVLHSEMALALRVMRGGK